ILPLAAAAQTSLTRFFSPVYYAPAEMEPGQTNKLKAIIFGESAVLLPTGLFLVKNPRIEHFSSLAQTNLVAVSPECFFDSRRNTINSTNVLVATVGTNQMRVE